MVHARGTTNVRRIRRNTSHPASCTTSGSGAFCKLWASEESLEDDVCKTAYSKGQYGTRAGYNQRVQDPKKHISSRLMHYFWFGGVLQAISEESRFPRERIARGGLSKLMFLQSGVRSYNIPYSANIVSLFNIQPLVKCWNKPVYRALVNYICGTENVADDGRVWRQVHRQLDRFQSENLPALSEIDFNGEYDENNLHKVEALITAFRDVIDKYVQSSDAKENVTKAMEDEEVTIFCISPAMLLEEGATGYNMLKNGTFVERYDRIEDRIKFDISSFWSRYS
uniref:Uncharacterized protein n=1 Tax=Anopheles dirus TaxID=7168 RepID=A0A9I3EH09_9DIPT